MAEPAVLGPLPHVSLPQTDTSDPNSQQSFDPLRFPDDTPPDLPLPPWFMADLDDGAGLDLEGDLDFSFADLLDDIPEMEDVLPSGATAGGIALSSCSAGSDRKERSGFSSSSSASRGPGDGSPGRSGSPSPPSPDSGNSVDAASVAGESLVKLEKVDERRRWALKRKKGREDGGVNQGSEEEEKRRARLMRNRESAQLSRQRKNQYVEELEEKVRSMHSTITELNSKVSLVMAENASLRQQLGGGGGAGACHPPSVYPPPPTMAFMQFPWIPSSAYPLRPQVPLIPIPRWKPRQPAPAAKPRKAERKTKKVASVSFLGVLFCVLLVGLLVSNHTDEGTGELVLEGDSFGNGKLAGVSRGRILTVTRNSNRSCLTHEYGDRGGKMVQCRGDYGVKMARTEAKSRGKQPDVVPGLSGNASKPLLASLYVPRNDKLVKIDGNLKIHSVLASERAMSNSASGGESAGVQQHPDIEGKRAGSAIAGNSALALAIPKSRTDMGRQAYLFRAVAEHQRAVAYGSEDRHRDDLESTSSNGPVKEWFHEGLEGSTFSSGMCTEVFRFNVSTTNSGGITPATLITGIGKRKSNSSHPGNVKNRRALHPRPIPFAGTRRNETEGSSGKPPETSSFRGNSNVSSLCLC